MSALVIAASVVVVVISSSLGGSGESSGSSENAKGPNKQKEHHAKYYVVQPGDTFAGIAQKQGFTVPHLEELNPHLDTQLLPENGCVNLVPNGCEILREAG